ncbi:pre-mRNA-splicing factor ATP-dependent RNA helicase DEAH7 [Artemisia annua]|uniref:Pre-mRNA-splicing factor ATP-dependent RNA helicase DEAH7 n=1 Tax=Artemisia annua TaxID=35608 RepID=A0A2U1KHP3_ARTAN|nr:pre-mRNA-splicing factor ATP-dependent RNA helicase DEAH7 [Artemisia annua]
MAKISRKVPTLFVKFMRNEIGADTAVVGEDGKIDLKGDAKFGQHMKTGEYLPQFSVRNDLLQTCVAAVSVAKRVAEEMEMELADLVVYAIRF